MISYPCKLFVFCKGEKGSQGRPGPIGPVGIGEPGMPVSEVIRASYPLGMYSIMCNVLIFNICLGPTRTSRSSRQPRVSRRRFTGAKGKS